MQEPLPSLTRSILIPTLLGFAVMAGAMFPGCKKDEAPPPLPSSTAPLAESAAPVLMLQEEIVDAGAADADAGKAIGKGGGTAAGSLKKCCAALRQNAKSAPPPTNTYMEMAAAGCDGAVAAGQDRNSIVGQVRTMLKGAAMPADCY